MAEAKVVEQIAAPPARVFAVLGDFRGVKPGPGIESVDYEGEGVGMTRSIHLANGSVVERLESYDEQSMTWRYAIINESPLPFANYSATVMLTDNGDGTTTVDWTGTFEPRGVEEADAVAMACGIYTNAIKGARAALGAG
jgi:carbon monoxide dehydrogenase subunit G